MLWILQKLQYLLMINFPLSEYPNWDITIIQTLLRWFALQHRCKILDASHCVILSACVAPPPAAACMGGLMRCGHTQTAHNCGHSSLLSPRMIWIHRRESCPLTPPRPTTTPGTDWWDEILLAKIKRSQCQNNSWYAYLPVLMKSLISGLGG